MKTQGQAAYEAWQAMFNAFEQKRTGWRAAAKADDAVPIAHMLSEFHAMDSELKRLKHVERALVLITNATHDERGLVLPDEINVLSTPDHATVIVRFNDGSQCRAEYEA